MKLITSNIRFDNPDDENDAWKFRKEFLAKELLKYMPDLVATQEGRKEQLEELETLLPNLTLSDKNREWLAPRMYPSNFTSLEVLDSGDIWLSETPKVAGSKIDSSMFPRLMSWVKCSHRNSIVFIFNVHLDHSSSIARLEQCRILTDQIKKINIELNPMVLLGDFNSSPMGQVYEHICTELNLIDPWITACKEEETTYHKFRGEFKDGKRIDWLLHSNHFELNKIELIKSNEEGRYPSDHFPLFCDIILKNK